jgi:hypothetical protein
MRRHSLCSRLLVIVMLGTLLYTQLVPAATAHRRTNEANYSTQTLRTTRNQPAGNRHRPRVRVIPITMTSLVAPSVPPCCQADGLG